jgi:hypothetical protein
MWKTKFLKTHIELQFLHNRREEYDSMSRIVARIGRLFLM